MSYRVAFVPAAEKELEALDRKSRERALGSLARLAANPRKSPNVKALRGGTFRLRVGDWRVIYALHEELLLVLVVKVGHRREVYRRQR